MGTETGVGVSTEGWRYSGVIERRIIDTAVERYFSGNAAGADTVAVYLADIMSASGITVTSPDTVFGGAKLSGLSYSAGINNQPLTATYNLLGTSRTDTYTAVSAPTFDGTGTFRAPRIMIRFGLLNTLGTTVRRLQSFQINIRMQDQQRLEFSQYDPWDVSVSQPEVTLGFTWWNSIDDTSPHTTEYDYRPLQNVGDAANQCVIQCGTTWDAIGNIKFTLPAIVVADKNKAASLGNDPSWDGMYYVQPGETDGGFTMQEIPT